MLRTLTRRSRRGPGRTVEPRPAGTKTALPNARTRRNREFYEWINREVVGQDDPRRDPRHHRRCVHRGRHHLPGRARQVAAQLHPRTHRQLQRAPPAEGDRLVRGRRGLCRWGLVHPGLQAQAPGRRAQRAAELARGQELTAATRWFAPVSRLRGDTGAPVLWLARAEARAMLLLPGSIFQPNGPRIFAPALVLARREK